MATGDDGRYKRRRGAGDSNDDDEGENNNLPVPDKRRQVPAVGDGIGNYYYIISSDDEEMDGGDDGEDLIYYYSDDDAEETEVGASSAIQSTEKSYVILSEDDLRNRQADDTAEVAEVLSIPAGFAAVLLRHYQWHKTRLKEDWFSGHDSRIRAAAGLPPADGGVVTVSCRRLVCNICFGTFRAGRTRAVACGAHFYCNECWRGYIHAAVDDGAACLSLRCPDPSCSVAVTSELVDAVAVADDKARYAQFALWSYVDESGCRIKWCPGPRCGRAIEFFVSGGSADVFCECGHGFCWSCGEEAHRPVTCATVRAWLEKNSSDSASANWVSANTKHCPKCRRPIQKNQGCNHMSCRAPCYHSFCWICLDPLSNHTGCDRYQYNDGRQPPSNKAEQRQKQAKASLDRYLYHYERWAANQKSLEQVIKDMKAMKRSSELEKMAEAALEMDVRFVTVAYERVAACRRVLRWAYAYGYFLDPVRDAAKRALFDHLQSDAVASLERLHGCA
ncbi:unnamed protein product [Urochloa humidicola]